MAPPKLDQFVNQSQEYLRLTIAAQVLPAIVARGLHENPSQFLEHHWASLALKQAEALLVAHAMTPIKVD